MKLQIISFVMGLIVSADVALAGEASRVRGLFIIDYESGLPGLENNRKAMGNTYPQRSKADHRAGRGEDR